MHKKENVIVRKYKAIPEAVKLTIWTFIASFIQQGINILTTPIFTRMMSTSGYGEYSVFLSWRNVFFIFTSLRLYAGVYNKGLTKYKDNKDEFTLAMQYTTTVCALLIFALYLIFHPYINGFTGMSTQVTCIMFTELVFMTPMLLWSVRLRYDFKYKEVAIATILFALFTPTFGVIAVHYSIHKAYARIVSEAVVQIIFGAYFYFINCKRGEFRYNLIFAKFGVLFNLPLIPHYFSEYILNQSDRIMIQKLVGYSEAGLYSVAYSASMALNIISNSINQALVPWLYQKLDSKSYDEIRKVIVTVAILLLLPLSIFMALAPEVVYIMAGPEYSDAVRVMSPITSSIFFLFLYTMFANVEFYYDKNKFTMYISMIGAALNIILNYIFIGIFGYWAAGFTTFFAYGVYCVGHFMFMQKTFFKNENRYLFKYTEIFGLIGLLTVIMIIFYCLNSYPLIRYTITIIALSLIFYKRKYIKGLLKKIREK